MPAVAPSPPARPLAPHPGKGVRKGRARACVPLRMCASTRTRSPCVLRARHAHVRAAAQSGVLVRGLRSMRDRRNPPAGARSRTRKARAPPPRAAGRPPTWTGPCLRVRTRRQAFAYGTHPPRLERPPARPPPPCWAPGQARSPGPARAPRRGSRPPPSSPPWRAPAAPCPLPTQPQPLPQPPPPPRTTRPPPCRAPGPTAKKNRWHADVEAVRNPDMPPFFSGKTLAGLSNEMSPCHKKGNPL